MTPRRLAAYLELASHRRREEAAERLAIGALAAQGDSKAIQKELDELGG